MQSPEIKPLPVAVRVFPYASDTEKDHGPSRSWLCPQGQVVIRALTRSSSTQKLTIGSYRFIVSGQCLEEGLFYSHDLARRELQVLKDYVLRHNVNVARETTGAYGCSRAKNSWTCSIGSHTRLGALLSGMTFPKTSRSWRLIVHRHAAFMREGSPFAGGRTKTIKVASV